MIEVESRCRGSGKYSRIREECEQSLDSGVAEAGCKTAVGTRLKRAGIHWTVAGADAIIALRCCVLSGHFEAFWERRSAALAGGPH